MADSATSRRGKISRLPALPTTDEAIQRDLTKLRAVLVLLGAQRGSKVATARACTAEFKAKGLRVSLRSVYHWRARYLRFGFAGIARKRRSDSGQPRQFGQETLITLIDSASRVRRYGDVRREFRRLRLRISYEQFRCWIRRFQGEFRIVRVDEGGQSCG